MRIRLLVQMPEDSSRNGQPWPAKGESVELPTADAAHLVASGIAEEDTEPDPPVKPRGRRKAAAAEEE
ncbi:hypothetical protein [Streptomyces sp. NPDC050988]|uniref:hypothetical protein n=1 Tax=Streptomyces sp. NPDC050988 TaxID=3365637 RepID=UPI00378E6347